MLRFQMMIAAIILLLSGCASNTRDSDVDHPIFAAIRAGDNAALTAELAKNRDAGSLVSVTDGTPLCLAARLGRIEEAKTLLAMGASVNGADPTGVSALHFAVEAGNRQMVEFLLDHGANVDAKAKFPGVTGFSGGVTPFASAVTFNRWNVVEPLIEHGADVNWQYSGHDSRGTAITLPVIHYAVMFGGRKIVDLMLSKGARFAGTGIVVSAVNSGDVGILKLFLEKGAGVNEKAPTGWSALHAAAFNGRRDMVELLLTYGADINAKAIEGWTPLTVATRSGKADVAKLLREKGGR